MLAGGPQVGRQPDPAKSVWANRSGQKGIVVHHLRSRRACYDTPGGIPRSRLTQSMQCLRQSGGTSGAMRPAAGWPHAWAGVTNTCPVGWCRCMRGQAERPERLRHWERMSRTMAAAVAGSRVVMFSLWSGSDVTRHPLRQPRPEAATIPGPNGLDRLGPVHLNAAPKHNQFCIKYRPSHPRPTQGVDHWDCSGCEAGERRLPRWGTDRSAHPLFSVQRGVR